MHGLKLISNQNLQEFMNKNLQSIFDKAVSYFLEGNVRAFCKFIEEIEVNLSCDCFYDKQPQEVWEILSNRMAKMQYNSNEYFHNISFGYISLKINDYKNASKYLDIAIDNYPESCLAHSLLLEIEDQSLLNPKRITVPNIFETGEIPRYTYNFARSGFKSLISNEDKCWDEYILNNSLSLIDKAIGFKPEVSCFHSFKALLYIKLRNHKEAICYLEQALKHKSDLLSYYNLLICLYNTNNFEKANIVANEAKSLFQNNSYFKFLLGQIYFKLNRYKESIEELEHLKNFGINISDFNDTDNSILMEKEYDYYPNGNSNFNITKTIERLIEKNYYFLFQKIYLKAKPLFIKFEYKLVFELLEEAIKISIKLPEKNALYQQISEMYFFSLLKITDSEILIDNQKVQYNFYLNLVHNYYGKIQDELIPTKEEKSASNLKTYSSNTVFGFGKYKGNSVLKIINIDPNYIVWCIINVHHFAIENSLLFEHKLTTIPKYLNAVATNLVKNELISEFEEDDDYHEYDFYGNLRNIIGYYDY